MAHFVPTLQSMQSFIETLALAGLKALVDGGVQIFQATLEKKDLLYIPLGCFCIEKSTPGNPLIYGAHKSYMCNAKDDVDQYKMLTAIFAKSNRSVTRMQQILQVMGGEAVVPTA